MTRFFFLFIQFDLVKAEILKGGDKEVIQNFTRVEAFLNDNGHITDNVN